MERSNAVIPPPSFEQRESGSGDGVHVSISCSTPGATSHYTTDGSPPTAPTASRYILPLRLTADTTVAAVCVSRGDASP
eukprot:CAMPEP_0206279386 /NCGR_PEP_ID=MMETSP0047_2-20121206/37994_1 /ASSEMBLY_ACC=CAM_ASM_000192 /TAXON_ID=195065 /ORGANISM="Chroomonas mesostigmatica_cf, Strain CCMP1168" /LENGTH=78 /DNA_ID=CAMNT_0053709331 /DNA_START=256 /DNA_END=488 /DNA_ORIENTATION=+